MAPIRNMDLLVVWRTLSFRVMMALVASLSLSVTNASARYFLVSNGSPNETFIVLLRDHKKISMAQKILAGVIVDQIHVQGQVVATPVSYNKPWHFHFKPSSITFFTFAPTVCARWATTSFVESHLELIGTPNFMPLHVWCPVGFRLASELHKKK
jgi:hypothetical protein